MQLLYISSMHIIQEKDFDSICSLWQPRAQSHGRILNAVHQTQLTHKFSGQGPSAWHTQNMSSRYFDSRHLRTCRFVNSALLVLQWRLGNIFAHPQLTPVDDKLHQRLTSEDRLHRGRAAEHHPAVQRRLSRRRLLHHHSLHEVAPHPVDNGKEGLSLCFNISNGHFTNILYIRSVQIYVLGSK